MAARVLYRSVCLPSGPARHGSQGSLQVSMTSFWSCQAWQPGSSTGQYAFLLVLPGMVARVLYRSVCFLSGSARHGSQGPLQVSMPPFWSWKAWKPGSFTGQYAFLLILPGMTAMVLYRSLCLPSGLVRHGSQGPLHVSMSSSWSCQAFPSKSSTGQSHLIQTKHPNLQ